MLKYIKLLFRIIQDLFLAIGLVFFAIVSIFKRSPVKFTDIKSVFDDTNVEIPDEER